jgi:hypothetical protein
MGNDRFRMAESAPLYAGLIVVGAIAGIVIGIGAAFHWLF